MKTSALCILVLLIPTILYADEFSERAAITDAVEKAFLGRDFRALEDMAKDYRSSKALTGSGTWKLARFYKAFEGIADSDITDSTYWDRLLAITSAWANQYPTSPTSHIVHAYILASRAFSIRGTGWAKDVDTENWVPFKSLADKALEYLREHKPIGILDPHYFNVLSNIYKAIGTEESAYWKDISEGINLYPYYSELYFAAADYYSPRWHGSLAKIDWLAREAVKRTESGMGYGMYARIYWAATANDDIGVLFFSPYFDWETMKRGINDVLA
jgi:hypothetical protein